MKGRPGTIAKAPDVRVPKVNDPARQLQTANLVAWPDDSRPLSIGTDEIISYSDSKALGRTPDWTLPARIRVPRQGNPNLSSGKHESSLEIPTNYTSYI